MGMTTNSQPWKKLLMDGKLTKYQRHQAEEDSVEPQGGVPLRGVDGPLGHPLALDHERDGVDEEQPDRDERCEVGAAVLKAGEPEERPWRVGVDPPGRRVDRDLVLHVRVVLGEVDRYGHARVARDRDVDVLHRPPVRVLVDGDVRHLGGGRDSRDVDDDRRGVHVAAVADVGRVPELGVAYLDEEKSIRGYKSRDSRDCDCRGGADGAYEWARDHHYCEQGCEEGSGPRFLADGTEMPDHGAAHTLVLLSAVLRDTSIETKDSWFCMKTVSNLLSHTKG